MKQLYISLYLLSFSTILLSQNINRPNISAPFGLEINSYNGNLFYQRTDAFIPGQGLSLSLNFSYNSNQRAENRGVGNGWLFNYNMCYQELPDQSIVIDRMDGRRDTFTINGSNYVPPVGIFDSLSQFAPNQYKLISKFGLTYFFEQPSHKQATKIQDRNGNALNLSYSGNQLNSATDQSGRSLTFGWTGDYLTSVTDANVNPQRLYQYAYDEVGNLIKYTDPLGNKMHYLYGPSHDLISLVDGNGNEVLVSYNAGGAVRRVFTCETSLNMNYISARKQTFIIEENGTETQTTTYTFDENGNLLNRQGTCCGFNVSFEYDANGNLTKRTDANGNTTQFTYDNLGNRLTATNALNQTTTYTYESNFNLIKSLTDPSGNTTIFTYDANGNLTQIDRPMGISESYAYHANGNLLSTTDGNNNQTTYTYNANGYLTNVNYPIGSESYTYDAIGNLTTITDANNNTLNFTYDDLNRPLTVIDHLGNTRILVYDANGNLLSDTDENSNQQQYGYDILNRLNQVTSPVATYQYSYDPTGNLTQVLDGNLHTTNYEYNSQNQPTAEIDGEGNTTIYQYDNNGNLILRKDANGNVTEYTYDNLNRLIEKIYNGNTEQFSYDVKGNMESASNNDITINYVYDDLNRLIEKTYVEWGQTLQYTYDGVGNRLSMTDPENGVTNYNYDELNRLSSITNPTGSVTSFQYDESGRLLQQNHGNGTKTTYTYDSSDRLLSIKHLTSTNNIFKSFNYTYDTKGNRLSMTDQDGNLNAYTYDNADRLVSVNYGDGQFESFTYDLAGNRLILVQNGTSTNYSYDDADRIQSAGNANYIFDDNGNMITKVDSEGTTHYNYDGLDRLIKVTRSNGTVVEFQYDPFGNRLLKKIGSDTTKFVLDGKNVLMELDAANAKQARYTSLLGYDTWLSLERSGNEFVYHTDALGSIYGISDSQENEVNSYDYFAFGMIKNQAGTLENTLTYTGREWEEEARVYYYRARHYLPSVGRFLKKDKFKGAVQNNKTLNRYYYVENNPINFIDPSGFNTSSYRVDFSALLGSITFARNYDDKGGCSNTFTLGFGFTPGVSLTGGITATNANRVGNLTKGGGLIGATSGGEVLSIELNKVGGDGYDGYDLGIGVGASIFPELLVVPQFFGNYTIDFGECESDAFDPYREGNNGFDDFRDFLDFYDPFKPKDHSFIDRISATDDLIDIPRNGDQTDQQANSNGISGCVITINSFDPNEIEAPTGIGSQRWVAKDAILNYTIYFENDPDSATAAAQFVQILQTIDSDLDPQTFQLTSFGFGSFEFEIPANTTHYEARLDVADSLGLMVDIKAGIDYNTNQLSWEFESIDPITGFFTLDPFAGFLPINDSTGVGEGFVSYTIQAKESAITFDSIHAQAEIIFDTNDPLETNIEVNTIDADNPDSEVLPVIAAVDSSHLFIEWMGNDIGAGVESYTLYVSKEGGPFLEWLEDTTLLNAIYNGTLDSSYCFISLARDSVSNVENFPDSCITLVAFTADLLVNCPNLADLILNNVPIQGGIYRASNTINSNATLIEGNEVSMLAEQSVQLNADFYVLPGAVFYAGIEACGNNNLSGGDGQFQLFYNESAGNVEFVLDESSTISIYLEDVQGKKIAILVSDSPYSTGKHQINLSDKSNLPSSYLFNIQKEAMKEQILILNR